VRLLLCHLSFELDCDSLHTSNMTAAKPIIVIVPGGIFSTKPYDHVRDLLQPEGYEVIVLSLAVCGDLSHKTSESSEWKDMARKGTGRCRAYPFSADPFAR
jgi:hypothetical protein